MITPVWWLTYFSFGWSQILTFFGPFNEYFGGDYYMPSTVVMVHMPQSIPLREAEKTARGGIMVT